MGRAGCSGSVFLWGAELAGAELPTLDGASAAFTAHNTLDPSPLTVTLSPRESCHLSMPLSYCRLKVEKCVSGFKSHKKWKNKRLSETHGFEKNNRSRVQPSPSHLTDTRFLPGLCRIVRLGSWLCV